MNQRSTVAFSPYALYLREDWARLRADTPMPLSEAELENLSGLTEKISTEEVVEVYLPLSRLLNFYVEAAQRLHSATGGFLRKGHRKMPFVIGLAGSVAAGKSTTARAEGPARALAEPSAGGARADRRLPLSQCRAGRTRDDEP